MKHFLLLFLVAGYYVTVNAGNCARPNLFREKVYIYSTTGKVPIKISRCLFNDTKDAYSDISDNCVKAFQSGLFVDKWAEKNVLEDKGSPIVLEEYVSKADIVRNEVYLRSGHKCRYDRGFCYDPTETNTYAIVWEILDKSKVQCPNLLFKVFEGDVDIWEFKLQKLYYLFFYDTLQDEAFYLSLDNKGQCQETDVWYTDEGYIVSRKPLQAKDLLRKASLKLPTKGGVKSVKGGFKGGRITNQQNEYFYYRTKKEVSENILKHCDIKSLSMQELVQVVESDYLENPHNLHLILERYYKLIMETKEELLELIRKESTLLLTKELKEKLMILSERFEKTVSEILEIQKTLAAAGNLDGIRTDVDKLALQLVELLKRQGEFDKVIKQVWVSINENVASINNQNLELKSLSEKLEEIRSIVNSKIPEFITKSEVYEKINKVEQDFHKKLRDLALNVTLLLLEHQESGGEEGVRGKATDRERMETLIIDKLRSFNVDQFQTALDGLKSKVELLLEQLKYETYTNVSSVEETLLKKIADLAAQNQPILSRLSATEEKINELFSLIKILRQDFVDGNAKTDVNIKDLRANIEKIFENLGDYGKSITELKKEINVLVNKEIDFNPVYEKVKLLINEALKPRDSRLDSLDDISVKLSESIENSEKNNEMLTKEIDDLREALKKLESLKGDITQEFEKQVVVIEKKITDVEDHLKELSKRQDATDNELESSKKLFLIELEKLKNIFEDSITNLNTTITENRDIITKIQEQNTVLINLIDEIKKDVANQGQNINELKSSITEKFFVVEKENNKNADLINGLKENITDIYSTLRKHEDNILELTKTSERLIIITKNRGGTKGGTKGGVKNGGYYNQQQFEQTEEWGKGNEGQNQQEQEEWEYNGNQGGGYSEGGSYGHTKTVVTTLNTHGHNDVHHSKTKNSHGIYSSTSESDASYVIQQQQSEINLLRSQLADTHVSIDANEHRILHLELQVKELLSKLQTFSDHFESDIDTVKRKIEENHYEITEIDDELRVAVSKCCSATSSRIVKTSTTYGIKH